LNKENQEVIEKKHISANNVRAQEQAFRLKKEIQKKAQENINKQTYSKKVEEELALRDQTQVMI